MRRVIMGLRLGAATVVALLLFACTSDEANRIYVDSYAPRPVQEVEALYEAPTRPYDVIADFQARGATEVYMQKEAASIGADAVIVVRAGGSVSRGEKWADKDQYRNTSNRLLGTAIKYR